VRRTDFVEISDSFKQLYNSRPRRHVIFPDNVLAVLNTATYLFQGIGFVVVRINSQVHRWGGRSAVIHCYSRSSGFASMLLSDGVRTSQRTHHSALWRHSAHVLWQVRTRNTEDSGSSDWSFDVLSIVRCQKRFDKSNSTLTVLTDLLHSPMSKHLTNPARHQQQSIRQRLLPAAK